MTDKERYRLICSKEKSIPIFSQDWWLDAVCGEDEWQVYLVGNGMDIKATIPFEIEEGADGRTIGRIMLTQTNGIWIKYPDGQGIIAKQSYEEKIVNEVCDYLESLGLSRYDQQYHYNFTNYLPFFWRYYKEITRYTYVIEETNNIEIVRQNYSSKLKNVLRKAQKSLCIEAEIDPEDFYRVNQMSFTRQEIEIPYSYEYFYRLFESAKMHNACKLLGVRDEQGNLQSVAMIVWDAMSVYYLLNGTDPEYKNCQGNDLLIDYSINEAGKLGLKFDFEGSVIKNVNHAFREFGGIPKPYFRIMKDFTLK